MANVTTGRRGPGRPRKNVQVSGPVAVPSKKETPAQVPQVRNSFTQELKTYKGDILVKSYYNLARRLFKDGQFDELANIGKLLTRRMADLRRDSGGSTLH